MQPRISPKKPAKNTGSFRARSYLSKTTTKDYTTFKSGNTPMEFDFEIITPSMQVEERNSAYQFFSP